LAVDSDVEAARARVRAGIGFILWEPNAEGVLEANGLDPTIAGRIRDGLAADGVRGLVAAVDDEVVDALTIAGDPAYCLGRLRAAVALGVTHPTVSLLGDDPTPALEVLASLRDVAEEEDTVASAGGGEAS
jgi:hypothetical protein